MKTALTIAGSDCSGGAGVQADLKTFSAHGVFGMSVIAAVVAENTRRVIDIQTIRPANIVIDPVMYAKNGCPLMKPDAIGALLETIIPLADVLTPNIPEAEQIAGTTIQSLSDMERTAKKIYALGAKSVVIKGGHAQQNATDVLFDGERVYHFDAARIDTKNTHGTGCGPTHHFWQLYQNGLPKETEADNEP